MKYYKQMAPEIMTYIFLLKKSNFNLRNNIPLQGRSTKIVMSESETLFSLGLKLYYILPTTLYKALFKEEIRQ